MDQSETIFHVGGRYRVADDAQAYAWLEAHNLGALISAGDDGWPRSSASPLIVRTEEEGSRRVFAHLDGRNPQVAHVRDGRPLLYVAQGPRAYVSPGWYPRRPAAPAYLHVTVQLRGRAVVLDSEGAEQVLLDTVASFEGRRDAPWHYDGGERFLANSAKAITAFEIRVEGIEASCKLTQNRGPEERALVATQLEASEDSGERAIAELMRTYELELEAE